MKSRYAEVHLRSIVYDAADIERRMSEPHVIELARNIKRLGGSPINAPTVNDLDLQLTAGRDRLAALFVNGVDPDAKLWVNRITATAEELESVEEAENLLRRDVPDRAAKLAAYIERRTVEVEASRVELSVKRPETTAPVGRQLTARGEVVRAVAVATGRTPEAIRSEVRRVEAKTAPPPAAPVEPPTYADTFNAALDEALRALRHSRTLVRKVATDNSRIDRALEEIHHTIGWLDSARLVIACPGPGCSDGRECGLCHGVRWLTQYELAGLPADQRPRVPKKGAPPVPVPTPAAPVPAESDTPPGPTVVDDEDGYAAASVPPPPPGFFDGDTADDSLEPAAFAEELPTFLAERAL
jgi:hypothetical protein